MTALRKALTLRASSIGDCLMGKYLLEQVHAAAPEAQCTLMVASRAGMIRDLLAAYPWITVRTANRTDLKGMFAALKATWGSDATVTQYSGRGTFSMLSKFFARLVTKHGRLVGFIDPWKGNRFLFDHLLPFDSKKALILHEQAALHALGIPVSIPKPTLQFLPLPGTLERLGLTRGSYVLLHLFAGTNGRGFTPERRVALVAAVHAAFGDTHQVVLTGSAADAPYAKEAAGTLPVQVIAGETSVQELANVIDGARAVISIDTGVAHMTAQIGTPLVVARACFAYNWWVPEQYDGPVTVLANDAVCHGAHVADKADNCLNTIPVETFVTAACTQMGA